MRNEALDGETVALRDTPPAKPRTAPMHEALKAAIEERKKLAEAATPGPWVLQRTFPQGVTSPAMAARAVEGAPDEAIWFISTTLTNLPDADAAFLAANDPAFVIRACERDLRVLARHQPVHMRPPVACAWCKAASDAFPDVPYPCAEVRDLAAVYTPTDTQEQT